MSTEFDQVDKLKVQQHESIDKTEGLTILDNLLELNENGGTEQSSENASSESNVTEQSNQLDGNYFNQENKKK